MLVYRQRKLIKEYSSGGERPQIPDYWQAEIEKDNKLEEELRQVYESLKNQFDIILEDASTVFTVSESNFVSYVSEDEDMGKPLRLEFTDTISTIKQKIKAHLNLTEEQRHNLIEVS